MTSTQPPWFVRKVANPLIRHAWNKALFTGKYPGDYSGQGGSDPTWPPTSSKTRSSKKRGGSAPKKPPHSGGYSWSGSLF